MNGFYWNSKTGKFELREQRMSDGGASFVADVGISGQDRVREEDALDTTVVEFYWPNGISAVHLSVTAEAATTPELNAAAFCLDAPNATVAATWLTAGDARSVDSQRHLIKPKDGVVSIHFKSPITRLHVKRDLGSDALRFVAAGIEA